MAKVGMGCSTRVAGILKSPTGLSFQVGEVLQREGIAAGELDPAQIVVQNVLPELVERTAGAKYPAFYVYCERISNQLREKFRTFSGVVRMVIEVRVSDDRLENVGGQLQCLAEAVTRVLDSNRGDWQDGVFFSGSYDVTFSTVKHGGKNYLQSAKVIFELDVSE